MLLWLILIPALASALIGLLKFPGRATAIASASLSFLLTILALSQGQAEGTSSLQLTLDLPMAKPLLLLTALVTLAAAIGLRAPSAEAARSWSISMLLISCGATGAFMSDSVIAFYAFHELALIPTFVMIGLYGRGDRRTIGWTTTLYLGAASMVLLVGLILLCWQAGATTFSGIGMAAASDAIVWQNPTLIGGLLILGFGALVSLFPFHSWAAPAYASAPTPVSMMHAGVLKKFGLYGLFTIACFIGPEGRQALFGPWVLPLLLCLLGNVLWVGYVTVSKTRLDDMLGNSSVMHMGYLFLAFAAFVELDSFNQYAFDGAVLLMVAHGISIAMLFLLCGQIEAQTKTLELDSMGGLGSKLPALGFLFGLAGMASIGVPLLANFPGELFIFLSCFTGADFGVSQCSCCPFSWLACLFGGIGPVQIACVIALWGLVISAIYMLRAFRRIFTGEVAMATPRATQLSLLDICAASLLALALVLFGIVPALVLNLIG